MNKCLGCGALLQEDNKNLEGFISSISSGKICERCFRIRNYGDYKAVVKDNKDFIDILKYVDKTNDLVVLVVDLFDINDNLYQIRKYIHNDILLVASKRDLFPKVLSNNKLISYFDKFNLNVIDKLLISSNKNYNFDLLYSKINKYKKSNKVYVVGFTNAGKSTMINKLIKNYSNESYFLTTSILPSTTLNTVEVKLNDNLILIDTPGIISDGNIINYLDSSDIKNLTPKNTIKPISYQVKGENCFTVNDFLKVKINNNNAIFYFSNNLKIDRHYNDKKLDDLKKHILKVSNDTDIVISGLGFIKFTKTGIVEIYTLPNVSVYTRNSLI